MRKTKVEIPHQNLIDYRNQYHFLGSCFSEHLSNKMSKSGFSIHSNPFGVVFNPISLADFLLISDEELKNSVFEKDGVALSWLANSTCFAYESQKLKSKLLELRKSFLDSLSISKILFVTFGTAWVYERKSSNQIVANCHKAPNSEFRKRLLTVEEITKKWSEVIEKLKGESAIKIIFTVSPVRHSKDGLVENSRSKAVLLNTIHELNDKYSNVDYFPAYELVLDELRDYAYFKKDGVHPNEIAIDEIWSRFKETYFTGETAKIHQEYEKLRMMFEHKPLHSESEASKAFEVNREKRLEEFSGKYPSVKVFRNKP
ncbi:GSCFA domain-containing protein [Brumimicrobium oceani]|uniref:GSCFA domain protein n=1 Tax=Brumimicrobium oceani TaxID=2100725 RepID=A0A2U2XDX7_9FLAO|nr:GSCFA domain-containing protein [Brumimicrobium oceani]PWH85994.1 GSCFA domain protein [Brumimicrobium oceani]